MKRTLLAVHPVQLVLGLFLSVSVAVTSAAIPLPNAAVIYIDDTGRINLEVLDVDHINMPTQVPALAIWAEGDRECWQIFSGTWTRPRQSPLRQHEFDYAVMSRGQGSLASVDLELAKTTTQLAQFTVPPLSRALGGIITPYQGAFLLSPRVTFRREAATDEAGLPAAKAIVSRDGEDVLQVEFAENATHLRWQELHDLPEQLKNGLSTGNYELRLASTSGVDVVRFSILGEQQRARLLGHADALAQLLGGPGHPLCVQLAVDSLTGHDPAYLSDALDLLDDVPQDRFTPYLSKVKQQVIARLKDPGQAPAIPEAPGESVGDPTIDKARSLIFAGRWTEANEVLNSIRGDSPLRITAMADLYRAVILSEAATSKEQDAAVLFRRAISSFEQLTVRSEPPTLHSPVSATEAADAAVVDLFRAHNNFANFLLGRAQDRVHNHAFQMAAAVKLPLLTALSGWIEARHHYDRALDLANTPLRRCVVRINLARLQLLLADIVQTFDNPQDPGRGLAALREAACSMAANLLGAANEETPDPVLHAVSQELLAALYFRSGEIQNAAKYAETALEGYLHVGSLTGVESVHRLLGLCCQAEADGGKRDEALRHFLISQQIAEILRERYPADQSGLSRAGFFARRAYVNEQIVTLLIDQGKYVDALLVAESAKARALQDVLLQGHVSECSEASNSPLLSEILSDWPTTFGALEYFIGTQDVVLFIINPTGEVMACTLTDEVGQPISSQELIGKIRTVLDGITGLNRRGIKNHALSLEFDHRWQEDLYTLFRTLIPHEAMGVINDAETVLIVPHHILHYLPFAALVTERDTERMSASEMVRPKFLLDEHFNIVYEPSLSIWASVRRSDDRPISEVRAMGDATFSSLPNIARDLDNIRRAFGERVKRVYSGADMDEVAAKTMFSERGLAYLGSHGQNFPDSPLESCLYLRPTHSEDGELTAREIYEGSVASDLVILSACYSGLADRSPLPGDDLFGLQRALIRSGARGVVSGLWDIDDYFGMKVMGEFFERMARGDPAASALTTAQRTVLHKYRDIKSGPRQVFSHPYFWAVFCFTGDDRLSVLDGRNALQRHPKP